MAALTRQHLLDALPFVEESFDTNDMVLVKRPGGPGWGDGYLPLCYDADLIGRDLHGFAYWIANGRTADEGPYPPDFSDCHPIVYYVLSRSHSLTPLLLRGLVELPPDGGAPALIREMMSWEADALLIAEFCEYGLHMDRLAVLEAMRAEGVQQPSAVTRGRNFQDVENG